VNQATKVVVNAVDVLTECGSTLRRLAACSPVKNRAMLKPWCSGPQPGLCCFWSQ